MPSRDRLRQIVPLLIGLLLFFGSGGRLRGAEQAKNTAVYTPIVIGPAAQTGCIPPAFIPPDAIGVERTLLQLINQQRAAHSLGPLREADALTQAARRHSKDMAERNITSHIGSDGSTPGQRVTEACYEWRSVGEIIGWGFRSAGSMVNWWMNSNPHRNLILSTNLRDIGAGFVDDPQSRYGTYWTVNFGRLVDKDENVIAYPYTCHTVTGDAMRGAMLTFHSTSPCPTTAATQD